MLFRSKAEIEGFVGRPVSEWTASDLANLRTLYDGKRSTTPPTDEGPEPGEDEGESPLDFLCPDCGYSTEEPEFWDDHIQATGHGQKPKATTAKAKK